jgi:hypothetical protein
VDDEEEEEEAPPPASVRKGKRKIVDSDSDY